MIVMSWLSQWLKGMRAGSADPETLICSDLRMVLRRWIRPGKLLKYRGNIGSHFHDGLVISL